MFPHLSDKANDRFRHFVLMLWGFCMIAVACTSLLPQGILTRIVPEGIWDKAEHASAYLVLAFLPGISLITRQERIVATLAMILLGVVLEFAQALVPGRSTDILDAFANSTGAAIGWIFAEFVLRISESR